MKKLIKKLLFALIRIFTVKNNRYIIFESADFFYDNSYALFLYVKQNYPKYKLKYIVTNKEQEKTASVNGVSKKEMLKKYNNHLFTFLLYKYSLKALCVFTSYINYWKTIRIDGKVVFLGHGEFPVKNCDRYFRYLNNGEKNDFYFCRQTQFIVDTLIGKYPFLKETKFVVCGDPRNDSMFSNQLSGTWPPRFPCSATALRRSMASWARSIFPACDLNVPLQTKSLPMVIL